mmetsp:Transcript_34578/g.52880  ORF Transcript_34578/g.52880 Transcript_34578/m.52880 type:complete len:169 (+) Transcript_34578:225-731(+)
MKPLGFGWSHEHKFCFGNFQYTTRLNEITQQEEEVVKCLTQDELQKIAYVKREKEKPEEAERPVTYLLSQFHIIFVYTSNLTVLSSITEEVVYSFNFDLDTYKFRSAVFDNMKKYVLLQGQRDQLEYSPLENEGVDAWKQFLKKGHIKQALQNCSAKQRPYVAGIYAD